MSVVNDAVLPESKRSRTASAELANPDGSHAAVELGITLRQLATVLGSKALSQEGLLEQLVRLRLTARGSRAAHALDDVLAEAQGTLQGVLEALQAAMDECSASGSPAAAPAVTAELQSISELISYAHRLSFTTRAPPGFVPGQSQLGQFQPPAPQDLQFRASQLHEFSRQQAERQRAARQAATAAQHPTSAAPTVQQLSADQMQVILASMPKDWKPGDPLPGQPSPAPAATPAAAAPSARPAAAAVEEAADGKQATAKQRVPSEEPEREEGAAPAAPPLFSFALNQDLELLADLNEEDFGASEEEEDDSSSESGDSDSE